MRFPVFDMHTRALKRAALLGFLGALERPSDVCLRGQCALSAGTNGVKVDF